MTVIACDEGEFEAFACEQYAPLRGWLTAKGACRFDAEDVAQVALTKVWLRWPKVEYRRAYLYCVASNELGKLWRARARVRARDTGYSGIGPLTREETVGGIPARLQAEMVRRDLLALPGRQRAVLAGCCDHYQDTELAAALRMPMATVRSHRRHARVSLREFAAMLGQDPGGRMLRRAYEEMRCGDPSPPGSRPVISQSWTRSATRLPNPEHGPAVAPLSSQELALRRLTSPLAGIGPDACARQADTTGRLMVITDPDGRVLWRAGDRQDLRRGDHDGHGDGACLAEHAVGTSGVSLALAAGHPVVVCGPEHYSPAQHDLVCAGAPIHHPADGRLVGAVCISAPWPAAHPDMLKLIDETARRIRRRIPNPTSADGALEGGGGVNRRVEID
ncbi:GAF domain-containing protein [Actinomadura rubrisoli]|uniref:GAF domain-containing protein n=1 Tax=Actinomadura rubrisoli TaxID=2530368 RepID=A0A4R4ZRN5_9ACTN|nr:GAF domain-containing protein [Actinomadura rubrisoli]TDD61425.1 GAF domain-containing protein [Actinomadura rubrisoli]